MFGTKKNNAGKNAPISSHPLFAAVVALWFAALLGLGSLVLPVALFEKFVTATGVSSVVSAAQPPLGTTARIAIAVFAAIAGAVVGLLIARKVSSTQASTEPARNVFGKAKASKGTDPAAKMPISAHEELGTKGLDAPIGQNVSRNGTYTGKRRSLAVTDDSGPSDYLDEAPLPGGPAMVDQHVEDLPDEISNDGPHQENAPEMSRTVKDAPLELGELDLAGIPENESLEAAEMEAARQSDAAIEEDFQAARARLFDAPTDTHSTSQIPQAAHDPVAELREEIGTMTDQSHSPITASGAGAEQGHTPEEMGGAIPQAYNPLGASSDADEAVTEAASRPFAEPLDLGTDTVGQFAKPVDASVQTTSFQQQAPLNSSSDSQVGGSELGEGSAVGDKPLNDLGMVELVERFALALQAKADAEAEASAVAADDVESAPLIFQRSTTSDRVAAPFAPSEAEEAGNAVAEFFSAPAPTPAPFVADKAAANVPQPAVSDEAPRFVPAALQPLGFDDVEDDEEYDAPLSLSINAAHRPFSQSPDAQTEAPARPAHFSALDDLDEEPEEADEGGAYSSLLAMKSPFESGQEFVRVEEDDDGTEGSVQPAVIFPGSEQQASSPSPSSATQSTEPDPVLAAVPNTPDSPRLFDAPSEAPKHGAAPAAAKPNPGETEQALRDALEKLQRMSGAA